MNFNRVREEHGAEIRRLGPRDGQDGSLGQLLEDPISFHGAVAPGAGARHRVSLRPSFGDESLRRHVLEIDNNSLRPYQQQLRMSSDPPSPPPPSRPACA